MSSQRPVNDQDLELLSAYLDGELTAGERSALEARLKRDPDLRRELSLLRQTVGLIRASAPYKAPRNFTLTAEMLRARQPRVLVFPATALVSALSAVAAVVLVVAGLSLLTLSSNRMASPLAPSTERDRANGVVAAAPTNTAVMTLSAPTITDDFLRGEITDVPAPAPQQEQQVQQQAAQNTDALAGGDQAQKTATTEAAIGAQTAANQQAAQTAVEEAAGMVESALLETSVPSAAIAEEDRFAAEATMMPPSEDVGLFAADGAGGEPASETFAADEEASDDQADSDLAQMGELAESSGAADSAAPAQPEFGGRTTATDEQVEEMEAEEPPVSIQMAVPDATVSVFDATGIAQIASPTPKPPTPAPTATMLPSETPTDVPTATPTATHTSTMTPTDTPTSAPTATPSATATPIPPAVPTPAISAGAIGVILIVAGIMAFGLFALTTAERRRNR